MLGTPYWNGLEPAVEHATISWRGAWPLSIQVCRVSFSEDVCKQGWYHHARSLILRTELFLCLKILHKAGAINGQEKQAVCRESHCNGR